MLHGGSLEKGSGKREWFIFEKLVLEKLTGTDRSTVNILGGAGVGKRRFNRPSKRREVFDREADPTRLPAAVIWDFALFQLRKGF